MLILYSRECDYFNSIFIKMSDDTIPKRVSTASNDVGDAVGLEKSFWFVAIVNNNTEKSSSEKLQKMGIETYFWLCKTKD